MLRKNKVVRKAVVTGTLCGLLYLSMSRQGLSDIYGVAKSLLNTSRAGIILAQSVYDYSHQLGKLTYNTQQYHLKRSEIHTRVAKRILKLSEQNKGIYLKLGQYLGNLQRVVPREFTQVLHVLQDSAPSLPFQQIRIVLDEDLPKPFQDIFSQFDREAIAAASLAQVHRARLKTGEEVAVKIQYPFLRKQTTIDLVILEKITLFCNKLLQRNNYKSLDLVKLFRTWTGTLVQELDFIHEVNNAQLTAELFKNQPIIHIPAYHRNYSSTRVITMQFIRGSKINNKTGIEQQGLNPKQVAHNLVRIFGSMIFSVGHIHVDAHPGNILVRKTGDNKPEIVLLDHGLYRQLTSQFRKNFSRLWLSLITFDKKATIEAAQKLNISKHIQFLPLIFLYRTKESKKKIGDPITPEERVYLRQNDIANFQNVNRLLQDLPPDLMFVIRASNLISMHNATLGGTSRQRMLYYTTLAVNNVHTNILSRTWAYLTIFFKILLFERVHWLFSFLYQ